MSENPQDSKDSLGDSCSVRSDIILNPKEILALYASPAQIARGEMVRLANVFCFGSQVLLVVDTTAPLPRSQSKGGKINENFENVVNAVQLLPPANKEKMIIPEEDSLGPIPDWLKNELANAVSSNSYSKNVTTTGIGNVQESHPQNSHYNNFSPHPSIQHIRVKPFPLETCKFIQDTGAGRISTFEENNHKNLNIDCNSPINNDREKELEMEILQLKEELKKYKDSSNKNNQVDELLDDYKSRPNSKKSFWSRRGSDISRSQQKSKICSLQ